MFPLRILVSDGVYVKYFVLLTLIGFLVSIDTSFPFSYSKKLAKCANHASSAFRFGLRLCNCTKQLCKKWLRAPRQFRVKLTILQIQQLGPHASPAQPGCYSDTRPGTGLGDPQHYDTGQHWTSVYSIVLCVVTPDPSNVNTVGFKTTTAEQWAWHWNTFNPNTGFCLV